MKKIYTCLLLIGLNSIAFSQGLEIGVKVDYGTTWLFNKNIFDQGKEIDHELSFGGNFGLTAAFFFVPTLGIGIEFNSQTINQKYSGAVIGTDSYTYDAKDHFNFIQIPILLKFQTDDRFYAEFGPQVLFLNKATEELTTNPKLSPDMDYTDKDIKTGYNSTIYGLVLGFGLNFSLTDNLYLNTGFRATGCFSDFTKEFSEAELNSSTGNEIGIACEYAHYGKAGVINYVATNVLDGSLMLGLTYKFGESE